MKILCLSASGLHLGYVGCYGNEWIDTPTLDRLAAEGVVFDQHYADSVGSSRSCWTGRYDLPPTAVGPASRAGPAGAAPLAAPTAEGQEPPAAEPPHLPALLQTYGVAVELVRPAAPGD